MGDLDLTTFDVAVVAVVGLSALFALARGAVREALSIVAWVGAIAAAFYGFEHVRPHLQGLVANPLLGDALTAGVVFLVPLIVLKILTAPIGRLVALAGLGFFDRLLGLAFGAARGALIVCLAVLGLDFFTGPGERPVWLREARTLPYIDQGVDLLRSFVPEEVSERARTTIEGAIETGQALRDPERLLGPPEVAGARQPQQGYDTEQRRLLDRLIERKETDAPGAGG